MNQHYIYNESIKSSDLKTVYLTTFSILNFKIHRKFLSFCIMVMIIRKKEAKFWLELKSNSNLQFNTQKFLTLLKHY